MSRLAVALGAAALLALALFAAVLRGPGPGNGRRVEPSRGAAHLGGSVRGQHGPVRVPLAGQARTR